MKKDLITKNGFEKIVEEFNFRDLHYKKNKFSVEFDHTKAYILGLLVGGGKIDKHTFIIDLPYKKWGMDTKRMNVIATDIFRYMLC